MYVEHPYKFNDKFYAKVDGKFYEITREVAKAMLSAYRNEVYRSKKWQLWFCISVIARITSTYDIGSLLPLSISRSGAVFSVRIQMESECRIYRMSASGA